MMLIDAATKQSKQKEPKALKLYDVENFPLKVNRLRAIADFELWRPIECKVPRGKRSSSAQRLNGVLTKYCETLLINYVSSHATQSR